MTPDIQPAAQFLSNNYSTILLVTGNIIAYCVIIYIITAHRFSSRIYAWILILIGIPWLGLVLFYLFGRDWRMLRKELEGRKKEIDTKLKIPIERIKAYDTSYRKKILDTSSDYTTAKLSTLLSQQSLKMLTFHNRVEIFDTGEAKFASLHHDLQTATKFIHMQYYVWEDDELGQKMSEILKCKAKQGVEVRILIDFEGSFRTITKQNYLRNLRQSGVDIRANQQWWNLFQFNRQNYRDHRKLVVIDGAIGYFGGMNVGQNYIDGGKKFPKWVDAHAKIEGEAVDCLQLLFAQTWFLLTDEVLDENYFVSSQIPDDTITPLDLTVSGPTFPRETTKQLYIAMISNAKRRVWIESPYCVPDAAIQEALCVAALSGIDVRILMTGMADKKLPFWAANSYYPYLLSSGVKLYQYKSGFLHSKVVIMDDDFSCLGTTNLDNRSFRLNYEFTGLFYNKEQNQRISQIIERDLLQCQEIKIDSLTKLPLLIKVRNGISALFSPIL